MDIKECIDKGIVRKARIDTPLALSLLEMADIKETTTRKLDLKKATF